MAHGTVIEDSISIDALVGCKVVSIEVSDSVVGHRGVRLHCAGNGNAPVITLFDYCALLLDGKSGYGFMAYPIDESIIDPLHLIKHGSGRILAARTLAHGQLEVDFDARASQTGGEVWTLQAFAGGAGCRGDFWDVFGADAKMLLGFGMDDDGTEPYLAGLLAPGYHAEWPASDLRLLAHVGERISDAVAKYTPDPIQGFEASL